jgi:hypothetical protein
MYLSSYHFTGDPADLTARFHTMLQSFPEDELLLNVCVVNDTGLTVYDACPDLQTANEFQASAEFTDALKAAGLPTPVITKLGEVHSAFVKQTIPA